MTPLSSRSWSCVAKHSIIAHIPAMAHQSAPTQTKMEIELLVVHLLLAPKQIIAQNRAKVDVYEQHSTQFLFSARNVCNYRLCMQRWSY